MNLLWDLLFLLQDPLLLSSRVIWCHLPEALPVSPPPLPPSLSQDTQRWERSVSRVAEITSALIRDRSPALVGQLLQAWREAAWTENPLTMTHEHSRDKTVGFILAFFTNYSEFKGILPPLSTAVSQSMGTFMTTLKEKWQNWRRTVLSVGPLARGSRDHVFVITRKWKNDVCMRCSQKALMQSVPLQVKRMWSVWS